jgi:thiol-disulfide isomerase/thioredoxin
MQSHRKHFVSRPGRARRQSDTLRLLFLVLLTVCSLTATADLKPFTASSFQDIQQQYRDRSHLVVLWATDCPPCHLELKMLGDLLKDHPELPLVFIAAEENPVPARLRQLIQRYGLAGADHWVFADPVPARLRHSIDPAWYGELPRSYRVDAQGRAEAHSGILSQAKARAWLELP